MLKVQNQPTAKASSFYQSRAVVIWRSWGAVLKIFLQLWQMFLELILISRALPLLWTKTKSWPTLPCFSSLLLYYYTAVLLYSTTVLYYCTAASQHFVTTELLSGEPPMSLVLLANKCTKLCHYWTWLNDYFGLSSLSYDLVRAVSTALQLLVQCYLFQNSYIYFYFLFIFRKSALHS